MESIEGKWTRSGSVPQDTAAWVDEYIFNLSGAKITGTYRHYHEGPGPTFSDIIVEEIVKGNVSGEIFEDEIEISVKILEGFEEGKITHYKVIPAMKTLDLIFTREDGSLYSETLRKEG